MGQDQERDYAEEQYNRRLLREEQAGMNVRFDETVHAIGAGSAPLCGTADIPAWESEYTEDDVNCWECESLIG